MTRTLRPSPLPSPRRGRARRATAVATFLLAVLGLAFLAVPAWAHGGDGKVEIVSTEPQADGASVRLTARVTFTKDGHPAADATVTVVGERAAGSGDEQRALLPVTLAATATEGEYAGLVTIPAPGTWDLRVTSVEPPATATTQVSTAATAGTPQSPADSGTDSAPTTTAGSSAAAPAEDGPNALVTGAVAGAVGGAVAAFAVGMNRRRKAAAGDGASGAAGSDAG